MRFFHATGILITRVLRNTSSSNPQREGYDNGCALGVPLTLRSSLKQAKEWKFNASARSLISYRDPRAQTIRLGEVAPMTLDFTIFQPEDIFIAGVATWP